MSAFPPPTASLPLDHEAQIEEKDRPVCVLMHLSALAGYLIPLANFLIPLVIWLVKKNESPTIDHVGREVLNFNISILIYAIVSALLMAILIGFLLLFVLYIFGIVVTILAAVKANDGRFYRYPFTIRML